MPPKKAIPIRRGRAKSFRACALKRLSQKYAEENQDKEFDASEEVTVTPMLKSAEEIPRILEALRAHDDEDARSFMEVYDSLSVTDRQYLKLEEIAVASGITSLRLAEVSTSAVILHGKMTSQILLASSMPAIIKTSVRLAKTSRGLADREMMLKAGGVLPIPKGATTVINNTVVKEKDDEEKERPAYLDAGQRLRALHDAVEQRRLPSPPSGPFAVGGRLDHMQAETAEIIGEHSDV